MSTNLDSSEPLAAQRTLSSLAALGAVIWAALIAAGRLFPSGDDPVSHALLLAILVLVPLGLSLVRTPSAEHPFFALFPYLLPPAQLAGAIALLLPTGGISGAAASLWLMATILIAVLGLGRLRSSVRSSTRVYDLGVAAAWLLLPVGAVWLVMARVGASPLGLSSLLVSLTAVHFHFTSFTAPTLVALAWDRSSSVALRRALALALGLISFSVVIVAVGITLSPASVEGGVAEEGLAQLGPQLSRLGSILLTIAFVAYAITVIGHVGPRLRSMPARLLTSLGALAPLGTLPLAVLYTFGQMDLDTMITFHGSLNAYGFAALSLLGWGIEIHGRRA